MEGDDVQMHHTAVQLRQMMPQADYLDALGNMMADMEVAAKEGANTITFNDGDYEVDDMQQWADGNEASRAGRIAKELKRLGFGVYYKIDRPLTAPQMTMIVSW